MEYTRSKLFTLLTEACELEHGLACSYLYTAFSIKKDIKEGQLSARDQWQNRKWAADIFHIAAQEMLHLSQVWNLLAAIGGNPYYLRPNFPQPAKYYSLGVPLQLEPFNLNSLKRFILYERPSNIEASQCPSAQIAKAVQPERTVGELYAEIRDQIANLDEKLLFVGSTSRQVEEDLVDFPDLIPVRCKQSALDAVDMITEQGEGIEGNRENSHYQVFVTMHEELEKRLSKEPTYNPSRNTLVNPATRIDSMVDPDSVTLIKSPIALAIANCFDDIYEIMMRMLSYVFVHTAQNPKIIGCLAASSIRLMTTVTRPIGEELTLLTAGVETDSSLRAGPTFRLSRHVTLPPLAETALLITCERIEGIIYDLENIVREGNASKNLETALNNLRSIHSTLMS